MTQLGGRRTGQLASRPFDPWAIALATLVLVAVLIFLVLPGMLVNDTDFKNAADRYKAENDLRATGLQLLGALVLVVGAYFTTRTFRLTREGQLTDRFSTAVDHLGSDKLATCLGGVYALERITGSDPSEQGSIVEILSAFVRDKAREPRDRSESPPLALQAAVRVIGRRKVEQDPPGYRVDLSSADLRGVSMVDGHFAGSDLMGSNLSGADLRGADLTGARLRDADLTAALLGKVKAANADITGAQMSRATIEDAVFTGARQYGHAAIWPLGVDPNLLGVRFEADRQRS
jgi:hypothetical protein